MRRIALFVLSTLSSLVLLFGYSTSTSAARHRRADSIQSGPIPGSSASASAPPVRVRRPALVVGRLRVGLGLTAAPRSPARWPRHSGVRCRSELTVTGGTISKVTVLQYPSGNGRDQEINDYALPILTQETVDAQSAQIDMVSGATVTSNGYLESLQSALDQARL